MATVSCGPWLVCALRGRLTTHSCKREVVQVSQVELFFDLMNRVEVVWENVPPLVRFPRVKGLLLPVALEPHTCPSILYWGCSATCDCFAGRPPRKIIVVRHGQRIDDVMDQGWDLSRPYDPPLTDEGRRMARELGQSLARQGLTFGAVFTSPFLRLHTAAPAHKATKRKCTRSIARSYTHLPAHLFMQAPACTNANERPHKHAAGSFLSTRTIDAGEGAHCCCCCCHGPEMFPFYMPLYGLQARERCCCCALFERLTALRERVKSAGTGA